ncbi:MAG: hypothetical protein KDD48_01505 [Bdellovibrionales bacterium]|nr:hypothetical protein [Bdellovibrionales bacterium]
MKQHNESFLSLVREVKKNIKELTVDDVAHKFDHQVAFTLIDVREESEWNQAHIKGAIHLSKGILERDIESKIPNKSEEIILYCGGGYRSALAAENLQKMGYTNVYSMDGGWTAWNKKHFGTKT